MTESTKTIEQEIKELEAEMLPCPFCGSSGEIFIEQGLVGIDEKREFYPTCSGGAPCPLTNIMMDGEYGTVAHPFESPTAAAIMWNVRTDDDSNLIQAIRTNRANDG